MEENNQVPQGQVPSQANSSVPVVGFQTPQHGGKKKPLLLGLAVLIVIAAAGWFAYAAYASPSRVWQKFVEHREMPKVMSGTFSFSYEDKGKASEESQALMLSNIKFSAEGNTYANVEDPSRPEIKSDFDYSFGLGDTKISSKAKFIMLNEDFYFSLGKNPFLDSVFAYIKGDEDVEWIKLSPKEIQKAFPDQESMSLNFATQIKKYQDIFNKYSSKVILMDKFIDRETIRGVKTLHYSNKLDKEQAKSMLTEAIDFMISEYKSQDAFTETEAVEMKRIMHKTISLVMDKFEIQSLETWVGAYDLQPYKVKLTAKVPSLVSLIEAMGKAEAEYPELDFEAEPEKALELIFKHVSLDGEFVMEEEMFDYGKKIQVTAPEKYLDLIEKIKEFQQQFSEMQKSAP